MNVPPTPNPGPEAPATINPSLPSTEPTYRHAIRLNYPDIAKLAKYERWAEMAIACENLEVSIPDDTDASRLLVTAPLVLASALIDEIPAAFFALKRLPQALASGPLSQALLSLVASLSDRKYHNILPRIADVMSISQNAGAVDPELGLLVYSMASALQVAWRQRIVELLSRAYSSIPAAQAAALLNVPAEKIATELPAWRYEAPSQVFYPSATGTGGKSVVSQVSTLPRFNDVVAEAVHLESGF